MKCNNAVSAQQPPVYSVQLSSWGRVCRCFYRTTKVHLFESLLTSFPWRRRDEEELRLQRKKWLMSLVAVDYPAGNYGMSAGSLRYMMKGKSIRCPSRPLGDRWRWTLGRRQTVTFAGSTSSWRGSFSSVPTLKDDFLHLLFSCRRRDKELETEMVKNKLMGRRHGGILRRWHLRLIVDGSGNYTVKLLVNPDVVSHLMTFTRVITFMSEFCVPIEVTSFLLFSCSAITASQRERPFHVTTTAWRCLWGEWLSGAIRTTVSSVCGWCWVLWLHNDSTAACRWCKTSFLIWRADTVCEALIRRTQLGGRACCSHVLHLKGYSFKRVSVFIHLQGWPATADRLLSVVATPIDKVRPLPHPRIMTWTAFV